MNNKFLTRLQFVDKIAYDRASGFFSLETSENPLGDEQNAFLLSLLDSGEEFDDASVINAINFTRSWLELGFDPGQTVLVRLLCLCFYNDMFVNPVRNLAEGLAAVGWVYRALSKMVVSHFDVLRATIARDAPIWDFLCALLRSDVLSMGVPQVGYADIPQDCAYLIEGLIHHWPSEKVARVAIDELVVDFVHFCMSIDSETATDLMNVVFLVFPGIASRLISEDSRIFARTRADVLVRLKTDGLLKLPEHLDHAAIKLVVVDPAAAISAANDADRELIANVASKFSESDRVFRLE